MGDSLARPYGDVINKLVGERDTLRARLAATAAAAGLKDDEHLADALTERLMSQEAQMGRMAEALKEWADLADHLRLSTERHRKRTRALLTPDAQAAAEEWRKGREDTALLEAWFAHSLWSFSQENGEWLVWLGSQIVARGKTQRAALRSALDTAREAH